MFSFFKKKKIISHIRDKSLTLLARQDLITWGTKAMVVKKPPNNPIKSVEFIINFGALPRT